MPDGDADSVIENDDGVPAGLSASLLELTPAARKLGPGRSTWTARNKSVFDIDDQYGDD
jgi:hypothetical protein